MTFALVSHTVLTHGLSDEISEDVYGNPAPFGRTGCDLLPDGSYIVSAYYDAAPTDLVKVWKVSSSGAILGTATVDTLADDDGRMQVIALDGFLVQVLYMTQGDASSRSYIFDCSGDVPELVTSFNDAGSTASGYTYQVHHLYLRSIGVVAICHRMGVSIYRRGRHLMSRSGADADGESYGIYPHPTDERKFAVWFSSGLSGIYLASWEYTVTENDELLVEQLAPTVSYDSWWIMGAGSPYAAVPLAVSEYEDYSLGVHTAADPLTALWSTGIPATQVNVNADPISCNVGQNPGLFAFAHEAYHDVAYPDPEGPEFTMRCGLVDGTGLNPVAEILDLPYGATSPAGYPYDMYFVSLLTGSMGMSHRDGQIVVSTCIVQQDSPGSNYYAVVSWKLQIGNAGRVRLSATADGTSWRYGINNASGRLNLQSSVGLLHEASQLTGIDAPARPAWVQTSQGWELLGRFVDPSEPLLSTPSLPATLDIVYRLSGINLDLAEAATIAGPTYSWGGVWGPFVAQASPPDPAIFTDGSDATFTTLNNPPTNTPIEVFTTRFTPISAVPAGAQPLAVAFTIRGQAAGGDRVGYVDGQITVNGEEWPTQAQNVIRGIKGNYNLLMPFNLGPGFTTSAYGITNSRIGLPEYPGQFADRYSWDTPLARAMYLSDEGAAIWWAAHLADPTFYVVVHSTLQNTAHGPFQISEMFLTMRYLIPEAA